METKAIWDENKKIYKLYGTKTWISNAPIADILIIFAKSQRHNNRIKVLLLSYLLLLLLFLLLLNFIPITIFYNSLTGLLYYTINFCILFIFNTN